MNFSRSRLLAFFVTTVFIVGCGGPEAQTGKRGSYGRYAKTIEGYWKLVGETEPGKAYKALPANTAIITGFRNQKIHQLTIPTADLSFNRPTPRASWIERENYEVQDSELHYTLIEKPDRQIIHEIVELKGATLTLKLKSGRGKPVGTLFTYEKIEKSAADKLLQGFKAKVKPPEVASVNFVLNITKNELPGQDEAVVRMNKKGLNSEIFRLEAFALEPLTGLDGDLRYPPEVLIPKLDPEPPSLANCPLTYNADFSGEYLVFTARLDAHTKTELPAEEIYANCKPYLEQISKGLKLEFYNFPIQKDAKDVGRVGTISVTTFVPLSK